MSLRFSFLLCLIAPLCISTSFAATAATPSTTANTPVAYVYVTSNYSGSATRIVGYAAAADGKLTHVPGSPFPHNVRSMAVNGKFLFASTTSGDDILTLRMESNGSLKMADTADIKKMPGSSCSQAGTLAVDRTGATLYPFTESADCTYGNNAFQSLKVSKTSGALTYLSETFAGQNVYFPLSFIGTNKYAYDASCLLQERNISGYERKVDGSLVDVSIAAPFPDAPNNEFYCPSLATADATHHLAMDMSAMDAETISPKTGSTDQLAIYTVDETNGNLYTASNYENMPHTAVASVRAMSASPSGKLLAVGGTKGLQIFHFNGGEQLKAATGLLTGDAINQVYWDNANHLYAISNAHDKLFVFTVTPTMHREAPGSPYTITRPKALTGRPIFRRRDQ